LHGHALRPWRCTWQCFRSFLGIHARGQPGVFIYTRWASFGETVVLELLASFPFLHFQIFPGVVHED